MTPTFGTTLIALGVVAIVIGLLAHLGALAWFGHLPGDIHIERENVRVYIPIVSMLLLSVALSIVLSILRRF